MPEWGRTLTFKARKEIFSNSVVVIRIAFAGHALPNSKPAKGLAELFRAILNTTVRVKNQPFFRLLTTIRHV